MNLNFYIGLNKVLNDCGLKFKCAKLLQYMII